MKRLIKFLVVTLLLSLLFSMSVLAANEDKPIDKDKDGRISQGYIIIGESHIGVYGQSMASNNAYPVTKKIITSPNGMEVMQFGGIPTTAPAGVSGIWTVVGSDDTPQTKEYLTSSGAAYAKAAEVIAANPSIEHWNIISCWGTNFVLDAANIDYVINGINTLPNAFPGIPTTGYCVTVPDIVSPPWPSGPQVENVKSMNDRMMSQTIVEKYDLRDFNGTGWAKWQKQYQDSIVTGDKALINDTAYNGNWGNTLDNWDGCHVTMSAYQDVFGTLIQFLENSLGQVAKEPDKKADPLRGITYDEMAYHVEKNPNLVEQFGGKSNTILGDSLTGPDSGFIHSFYKGLSTIGVPLETIGEKELPCRMEGLSERQNMEMLVFNIWKKYWDIYDKNNRYDSNCFNLVQFHWIEKTTSDVIQANQLVPKSFMELDNAGRLNWVRGSLNNKEYSDEVLIKGIFQDWVENSHVLRDGKGNRFFYIIQAGGAEGNKELSPDGKIRYYRLLDATSTSLKLEDTKNGTTKNIVFAKNGMFVDNMHLNPFGIMDTYRFEYVGPTGEYKGESQTPPPAVSSYEHLTIREVEVKIPNFNGVQQFLWMSDLHLICDDNIDPNRYLIFYNGNSVTNNGELYLQEAVACANDKGLPLVLGGDIADYASQNNYNAISNALSGLQQRCIYLIADHDYAVDLSNPDGWTSVEARAKLNQLPYVQSQDLSSYYFGSLNVYAWSNSTNKTDASAPAINYSGPSILLTHVPFDIGGLGSWTITPGVYPTHEKQGVYAWSDKSNALYKLADNAKASAILRAARNGVGAVFSGHTHMGDVTVFKEGGLTQVAIGASFSNTTGQGGSNGFITLVTVKGE